MKALAVLATVQCTREVELSEEVKEALRGDTMTVLTTHLGAAIETDDEIAHGSEVPFRITVGIGTPEWADSEVAAWGDTLGREEVVFRLTELLKLAAEMGADGPDLGQMTGEALRRAIEATEPKPRHNGAT